MTKKLTVKVSRKNEPEILRGFRTFPLMSCGNSIPMSILSCSSVKAFLKRLRLFSFCWAVSTITLFKQKQFM